MSIYTPNNTFNSLKVTPQNTQYKVSTPQKSVVNNKQDKKDTTKKVLLATAAASAATLAAIYGVRKYNVTNIKNIQKAFQETFMRDDITVEQAREMMKRYRDIEKISDREEYAKALFEEAKKNFGLENSPIKLVFEDKKGAAGFCTSDNSAISITSDCSRKGMLDAMHHEFRHAKQHNAVFKSPEYIDRHAKIRIMHENRVAELVGRAKTDEELKALRDPNFQKSLREKIVQEFEEKGFKVPEKDLDRYESYKTEILEKSSTNMVDEKIPTSRVEEYENWVEKSRDGIDHYVDMDVDLGQYWDNFIEVDARKAGRRISKYVRAKAFTFGDWLDDFSMKYFRNSIKHILQPSPNK